MDQTSPEAMILLSQDDGVIPEQEEVYKDFTGVSANRVKTHSVD